MPRHAKQSTARPVEGGVKGGTMNRAAPPDEFVGGLSDLPAFPCKLCGARGWCGCNGRIKHD